MVLELDEREVVAELGEDEARRAVGVGEGVVGEPGAAVLVGLGLGEEAVGAAVDEDVGVGGGAAVIEVLDGDEQLASVAVAAEGEP